MSLPVSSGVTAATLSSDGRFIISCVCHAVPTEQEALSTAELRLGHQGGGEGVCPFRNLAAHLMCKVHLLSTYCILTLRSQES